MFRVTSVTGLAVLTLMSLCASSAHAQPAGYKKVDSAPGVALYQKGTEKVYVTVANLPTTRIISLTGKVSGAPNGTVSKKSLLSFWNDAVAQSTATSKPFVVFNGTFFNTEVNSTPISFGLKTTGLGIISYGSDLNNPATKDWIQTLAVDNKLSSASIQKYSRQTFDSKTPDVIGGLSVDTPSFSTAERQRTFVGVDNRFLFVLTTQKNMYPKTAAAELRAWGATGQIMLDGGGSTGLVLKGSEKLPTSRLLPHAVAIYSGK